MNSLDAKAAEAHKAKLGIVATTEPPVATLARALSNKDGTITSEYDETNDRLLINVDTVIDNDGTPEQFRVTNGGAGSIGFRNAGAGNQQFNLDCYVNAAGTLIASATAGSRWIQGSETLVWQSFSSETIGTEVNTLTAGVTLNLANGGITLHKSITITPSTLLYASPAIDFAAEALRTVTLTGNITFTTSNLAAGKSVTVRIIGDGSIRTLTFPAGWKFVGAAAPTQIAANKIAILTLTSFSTTDANVVAAYAEEP